MNIYVIRHGQSEGNVSSNVYGATDYPLTALGRQQAEIIRDHFREIPLKDVYTSPLSRAKVIGEMIAETHGLEALVEQRLTEIDFGIFDDMPLVEVKERIGHEGYLKLINPFEDFNPEGGIDHKEFRRRIHEFIDELVEREGHTDNNVAITCHLGIIRVILQKAIKYNPQYVRLYKTSPGSILRIQYKKGVYKLVELIQTMED